MTTFSRTDPLLGTFALRPVDPDADVPLLHAWLTDPKSVYWLMTDATRDQVAAYFRAIADSRRVDAYLGLHDGRPAFLAERYDPRAELDGVYPIEPGDVGMHFLVAPSGEPLHGFTRAVLTTIMEMLFADPATERVVVEPDARNTAVHTLNAAVGFRVAERVALPGKEALLSFCTREQYEASRSRPADAVAHLTPALWDQANRLLVRKALAEFAHERLIAPESLPDGRWAVRGGGAEYRFAAEVRTLEHWRVEADSIVRLRDGEERPLDAGDLVIELREALELPDEVLPVYLEEITSTLAATAFKLARPPVPVAELADAGFQAIEAGMTEGHPCFVAGSGRLGLDAAEYLSYAPEAGRPVRLLWLAARRDRATFTCGAGLSYDELVRTELGEATLDRFAHVLRGLGLDLDDHVLIPVHPWQWWNRLAVTFAGEVARRRLVCLGYGDDEYQAQQSIRTFFNTTTPARHYVKTSMSVLNMGFLRGLSAAYMKATPAINDWLADLVAGDAVLKGTGLTVLRERAAVGYHHEQYAAATRKGSPYLKMLAALWRESPIPQLGPGERLATMASLLHVDRAGASFAAELVRRSGLAPAEWLRRYLGAYLTPLLHCFFAYELVFMPHGENVILVLDEHGVPVRALFKDIAEEIAVLSRDTPLPPEVERIRAEVPDDLKALSIFTDVFDDFFRFLSAILAEAGLLTEREFWSAVAECVRAYQDANPAYAARFARYDLFTDRFAHSCLNRLQLRNNRQMVDLDDPAGALRFAGTLDNPIAPFR